MLWRGEDGRFWADGVRDRDGIVVKSGEEPEARQTERAGFGRTPRRKLASLTLGRRSARRSPRSVRSIVSNYRLVRRSDNLLLRPLEPPVRPPRSRQVG